MWHLTLVTITLPSFFVNVSIFWTHSFSWSGRQLQKMKRTWLLQDSKYSNYCEKWLHDESRQERCICTHYARRSVRRDGKQLEWPNETKQKDNISIGKMKCQPSDISFEFQQSPLVFHNILVKYKMELKLENTKLTKF